MNYQDSIYNVYTKDCKELLFLDPNEIYKLNTDKIMDISKTYYK